MSIVGKHVAMVRNPINVTFGKAVARRREELELTQAELAGLAGISRASIANIEKGRQNVLLHHIYDLADALQMPRVGDLLPSRTNAASELLELNVTDGALSPQGAAQISNFVSAILAANTAKTKS
jgi:transcriptional regulator with XRE-family HTH domain